MWQTSLCYLTFLLSYLLPSALCRFTVHYLLFTIAPCLSPPTSNSRRLCPSLSPISYFLFPFPLSFVLDPWHLFLPFSLSYFLFTLSYFLPPFPLSYLSSFSLILFDFFAYLKIVQNRFYNFFTIIWKSFLFYFNNNLLMWNHLFRIFFISIRTHAQLYVHTCTKNYALKYAQTVEYTWYQQVYFWYACCIILMLSNSTSNIIVNQI